MTDTLRVILKHKYYKLVEEGKKTIEYRKNTRYWRRRIFRNGKYKDTGKLKFNTITFHKGYTKEVLKFNIAKVIVKKYIIEIHLGEKIK